MKLPYFFSKSSKVVPTEDRFFLALIITNVTVQAGLWKVSNGSLSIDSTSAAQPFTADDDESLLLACDQALQELGKESEKTDEVVFGFELDWVSDAGIKDEKKPVLKYLSSELSLKPVGFVVIPEALLHGLHKDDPQCSLLMVQISANQLTISLIQKGVITASERVGRSDQVTSDVAEALARFNPAVLEKSLPGKMLIVGIGIATKVIHQLQQDLLSFDWSSKYAFIHPPVIEVMPEEKVISSVIEEGGKAVAQAQGIQVVSSVKGASLEDISAKDSLVKAELADLQGQLQSKPELQQEFQSRQTQPEQQSQLQQHPHQTQPQQETQSQTQNFVVNEATTVSHNSKPTFMYNLGMWWRSHKKIVIGSALAGLLFLMGTALVSALFLKQAILSLELQEEYLSKDVVVTLDPSIAESDPEALILKAETTSVTLSGSDAIAASGVTLVGERATGTVTIFNKTDSVRTFSAGTVLRSGSLRFAIDEEVQVASASVTESSSRGAETRVFGKAEVTVTAQEIGAEYNLAEETEFQIADFSSSTYTALSNDALTGGSSREVRVVSQEDKNKLQISLQETLIEEATNEFRSRSRNGTFVIPTGQVRVSSARFDSEVGDEVSSLELDLEIEAFAVVYLREDIQPLVEAVLKSELPDGYTLSQDDPQILTDKVSTPATSINEEPSADSDVSTGSRAIDISINIATTAIPILDFDDIAKMVAGRNMQEAAALVRDQDGVKAVAIRIIPSFVQSFSASLPNDPSKITVKITEQDANQDSESSSETVE